jgi:molecular chaperone DnaJ
VAQAALGCEIEVPTLGEPSKLKIPEGTQSGSQFRFRNKGVPIVNGSGRGDLLVRVEVKVPARISREQRRLLEQLRDTLPVDNAPAEKGLFEKVKDYFVAHALFACSVHNRVNALRFSREMDAENHRA